MPCKLVLLPTYGLCVSVVSQFLGKYCIIYVRRPLHRAKTSAVSVKSANFSRLVNQLPRIVPIEQLLAYSHLCNGEEFYPSSKGNDSTCP